MVEGTATLAKIFDCLFLAFFLTGWYNVLASFSSEKFYCFCDFFGCRPSPNPNCLACISGRFHFALFVKGILWKWFKKCQPNNHAEHFCGFQGSWNAGEFERTQENFMFFKPLSSQFRPTVFAPEKTSWCHHSTVFSHRCVEFEELRLVKKPNNARRSPRLDLLYCFLRSRVAGSLSLMLLFSLD